MFYIGKICKVFWIVHYLHYSTALIFENEKTFNTSKLLIESLLRNYDSYLHPFENGDKISVIRKQCIIDQDYVFDEETNFLHMDITMLYEWYDDRLRWNNTAFPNVNWILMDPDDVYTPKTFLANRNNGDAVSIKRSKAMVFKTGKVAVTVQESVALLCHSVNLACRSGGKCRMEDYRYSFPTDRYYCYYREYLEKHPAAKYDVKYSDNPTECINGQCLILSNHDVLEKDMMPKKWIISFPKKEVKTIINKRSNYYFAYTTIVVKRNDEQRFHLYVVPTTTLSILLLVQFILPSSSKARLLSIVILLCNLVAQMVELTFERSVRRGGGGLIVNYITTLLIINAITFGWSVLMAMLWLFGLPEIFIPFLKRLSDFSGFQLMCSVFLIPTSFEKKEEKQDENGLDDEAKTNFYLLCKFSIFIDRCLLVIGVLVAIISLAKLNANVG